MGVTIEKNETLQTMAQGLAGIRSAFEDAGDTHEFFSRVHAPVDDGDLRDSILSETFDTPDGPVTVTICGVYYGDFQEHGTGIYRVSGDGRKTAWVYYSPEYGFVTTKGNTPQPFMRPGFEQAMNVLYARLERIYS